MKNHKFQQIIVRIPSSNAAVRFSAETDKQFNRIRGIYISMKSENAIVGTTMGLKVNGQEVFDEAHEIRLLTCGNQVAPNQKFFLFEEKLEGSGSTIDGKVTDGGVLSEFAYPIDMKMYLWLVNDPPLVEPQE